MTSYINNCFFLSLFFTASMLEGTVAYADKATLTCPASISTAPAVERAPEGWSASRRAKEQTSEQAFSAATFTDGHPDQLVFLRPSGETKVEGAPWDVYDLESVSAESGVWLICFYKDTPAYLFKKLDQKPAKCSTPQGQVSSERAAVCE